MEVFVSDKQSKQSLCIACRSKGQYETFILYQKLKKIMTINVL